MHYNKTTAADWQLLRQRFVIEKVLFFFVQCNEEYLYVYCDGDIDCTIEGHYIIDKVREIAEGLKDQESDTLNYSEAFWAIYNEVREMRKSDPSIEFGYDKIIPLVAED